MVLFINNIIIIIIIIIIITTIITEQEDRDSSVVRWLATAWTVLRSNLGGGEIFRTPPDRPWDPHSLIRNGYRVFPGGKDAGALRSPPTPHLVPSFKKE